MRDEMSNFKNWTAQNLSCFSTKISEKSEFLEFPKDIIILLQKRVPLLYETIAQQLFSIEFFYLRFYRVVWKLPYKKIVTSKVEEILKFEFLD